MLFRSGGSGISGGYPRSASPLVHGSRGSYAAVSSRRLEVDFSGEVVHTPQSGGLGGDVSLASPGEAGYCSPQPGGLGLTVVSATSQRPSTAEVLAYAGLSSEAMEVRSSARLRAKPDADLPQPERAMALAEQRDLAFVAGTSSHSNFLCSHFRILKSKLERID